MVQWDITQFSIVVLSLFRETEMCLLVKTDIEMESISVLQLEKCYKDIVGADQVITWETIFSFLLAAFSSFCY